MRNIINYLKKTIKYILFQVLVKYFLCFIVGILLYIVSSTIKINNASSLINSIAATVFSLPIVFISYDLYILVITTKQRRIVDQIVKQKIADIFIKFLFFTMKFRVNHSKIKEIDISSLLKIINNNKLLFDDISNNEHCGFFIFGEFDNFDTDIEDILNNNFYTKYLEQNETSILCEFIEGYELLKKEFKFVNCDDFIKYNDIKNIEIKRSTFAKTSSEGMLFDIVDIPTQSLIHITKFPLYDDKIIKQSYKLSGTKAKSVSNIIERLYKHINRWLKLKNISEVNLENALIVHNRLFLDADVVINFHMKENISIRSGWN